MTYYIVALWTCLLATFIAGSVLYSALGSIILRLSGTACTSGTIITRTGRSPWYTCSILPSCRACSQASSLAASAAYLRTPPCSDDGALPRLRPSRRRQVLHRRRRQQVRAPGPLFAELQSMGRDAPQVPLRRVPRPHATVLLLYPAGYSGAARGDSKLSRLCGSELPVGNCDTVGSKVTTGASEGPHQCLAWRQLRLSSPRRTTGSASHQRALHRLHHR